MPTIAVINYKGGVGKTTLTANLGAELAYRGKHVLLVDLDPQASLTFSFVKPDYWQDHLAESSTIKDWFDSFGSTPMDLSSIIFEPASAKRRMTRNGGSLSLIPSHLGLINVDLELATQLGGGSLKQTKLNYLRVHRRLAEGLAAPEFGDFDVILIDCPPNFNVVTKTAIVASSHVLIPAKADYLSTLGIYYLQRSLDELVSDYNEFAELESGAEAQTISPEILGVVFTMMQFYGQQPISRLRPYIAQTRQLGVPVFDNYLRENKSHFGDAPEYGLPVVLMGDLGSQNFIVTEIEGLVSEFATRLGI